jgi:hypothetical protein
LLANQLDQTPRVQGDQALTTDSSILVCELLSMCPRHQERLRHELPTRKEAQNLSLLIDSIGNNTALY